MANRVIFYKKRLFWGTCGIPSLVAVLYFFMWATPRYESEAVLRVYAFSSDSSSSGMSMGMGGQASPGAYILKEIVKSWDCFSSLSQEKLSNHWKKGDFFTRFGGIRSLLFQNPMRLWRYYQSEVTASIDDESGLVRLNVDGYDPDFVSQINKKVLDYSQRRMQSAGVYAYQAERRKLEDHVARDRARLEADFAAMERFQKKSGVADYDALFSTTLSLINRFQGVQVTTEGKASAAQFFAERSQELAMLKSQLKTLNRHIDEQRDFIQHRLAPRYQEFSILKQAVTEDINVIQMDDQNLQDIEQLAYRSSYHVDVIEDTVYPTNATRPLALLCVSIVMLVTFILYLIVK